MYQAKWNIALKRAHIQKYNKYYRYTSHTTHNTTQLDDDADKFSKKLMQFFFVVYVCESSEITVMECGKIANKLKSFASFCLDFVVLNQHITYYIWALCTVHTLSEPMLELRPTLHILYYSNVCANSVDQHHRYMYALLCCMTTTNHMIQIHICNLYRRGIYDTIVSNWDL